MPAVFLPGRMPAPLRELRHRAGQAILCLMLLLPPALGWLAERNAMGWELVSLLGAALALAAFAARRGRFGRVALAACASLGGALLAACLEGAAATALPFAILLPCALLCDGRALGVALAVLAGAALLRLPPGEALGPVAGLAALAATGWAALRVLWWRLARQVELLRPRAAPATPVWTRPREGFALPRLLVQAERTPEGALRLAVAGHDAGRLRVTVR
jgi:hypothetical protein